MIIFGAEAGHGGLNPLATFLLVLLSIYIFVKFCGWAKNFQLSASVKKVVFILTGVGLVVFNVLYSMGNSLITQTGDWGGATVALVGSLVWVCIFAFVLMADTKTTAE